MSYGSAAQGKPHGGGCGCGCGGRRGCGSQSGRWVRRGSRIVLLPGGSTAATARERGGPQGEVVDGAPDLTARDFIHPGIDVAAQRSLFAMFRRGGIARQVALDMLGAVWAGSLRGIYQVDQLVPARRAREMGMGWWDLIPQCRIGREQFAVCVRATPEDTPLIVFHPSLARQRDPAVLGMALTIAFKSCGFRVGSSPAEESDLCRPLALKPR